MPGFVACRPESYHPFEDIALAHLQELGVRYVEIEVPAHDDIARVQADLQRYGLEASSLQGKLDVQRDDAAAQISQQMPAFEALGTKRMFLSVKAEDTPLDVVYRRLHAAGDVAQRHGVTLILETHPDLVTNAVVARQTFSAVAHPNVRMNFDTANVYFYNDGTTAVKELEPVLEFVGGVHLKDTDGGFHSWHFPALGEGVVDFPAVFRLLDSVGYDGPYTLEVEGIEGEEKTPDLARRRIADSVAYLRKIGRL